MRHLAGGQPFACPGENLSGRGVIIRTQYHEGDDLLAWNDGKPIRCFV